MNVDGHTGFQWSTESPDELDRSALGVLRTARDVAGELHRDPLGQARRTRALGKPTLVWPKYRARTAYHTQEDSGQLTPSMPSDG
ncbi:hypothetical protein ACFYXC_13035 [Streptomyces sp. NPDC002701]|uniref:hypothetical protein n=1 Tax=Streptomyces sp. NPDC002701 TaxID=3364661 RepID=UPI0036B87DCE